MNINTVAICLGSGLLVGSVAGVLPTPQFICFVIGITLINIGNLYKK